MARTGFSSKTNEPINEFTYFDKLRCLLLSFVISLPFSLVAAIHATTFRLLLVSTQQTDYTQLTARFSSITCQQPVHLKFRTHAESSDHKRGLTLFTAPCIIIPVVSAPLFNVPPTRINVTASTFKSFIFMNSCALNPHRSLISCTS
jgi:hypothetical protein